MIMGQRWDKSIAAYQQRTMRAEWARARAHLRACMQLAKVGMAYDPVLAEKVQSSLAALEEVCDHLAARFELDGDAPDTVRVPPEYRHG